MAFKLIWGTGLEHNDIDIFDYGAGDCDDDASISTTKNTGSYAMRLYANYGVAWYRTPVSIGSRADIDVGLWWRFNHYNQPWGIRARLNNGVYIELRWDTGTHIWDAMVNGAVVQNGLIVPALTAYHNVQVRFKVDASGYIYSKVDGVTNTTYEGDTRAGGTYITHIYLGSITASGGQSYVDDWVVGYGGWPGDLRIVRAQPTGDTATEEWTPSTGVDSYAMLDEVGPDDDTTYIYTSGSDGEQTLVDITNFSADGTPVAVQVWGRARNTDPSGDGVKFLASDGTYITELGEETLGTSYDWYAYAMNETSGSNAWSAAEVNQLQLGVEAS